MKGRVLPNMFYGKTLLTGAFLFYSLWIGIVFTMFIIIKILSIEMAMIDDPKINTLIISDHPLLLPVFVDVLEEIESESTGLYFETMEALDYHRALAILERKKESLEKIDLVLLEVDVATGCNGKYLSGEGVAEKVKELFQKAKIIISTAFKNNYRICSLLERLNPEGFFIRTDMDREVVKSSIITVLEGDVFYSKGVLKFIRRRLDSDFCLDPVDIRLLYELSQGSKMKDLPAVLPFTLGAIEKRKQRIKARLGMEEANDRQLLDQARCYGFI